MLAALGLVLIAQVPPPAVVPAVTAGEPLVVLAVENAGRGADLLLPLAQSGDPVVQAYAIRALGRLEDASLLHDLVFYLHSRNVAVRAEAATAMAQSMAHVDGGADPETVATAARRLFDMDVSDPGVAEAVDRAVGRLRYGRVKDLEPAERFLRRRLAIEASVAARALESLARRNQKIVSFAPETVEALAAIVRRTARTGEDDARRNALAALLSAHAMDAETQTAALDDPSDEVRRLAVAAAAGGANMLAPRTRAASLHRALADPSALVRYEAVRGYARLSSAASGCRPLLTALGDASPHVMLAALDALGEACLEDGAITDRVVAEARTPPTTGSWHREAHALVALAKRAPARATISMPGFASHQVWQVRMYAARAAAAMKDVDALKRLAADRDDNVMEAAIGPLHTLDPEAAAPLIESALTRSDPQLLRTAALLLKDAPASPSLVAPLVDALMRLTKDGRVTSRDARTALLDALKVHAGAQDLSRLKPLLKDFDPVVAGKAASLISEGSGRTVEAEPTAPVPRRVPEVARTDRCVSVALGNGHRFRLSFLPSAAPLATGRFLRLALHDQYYEGLTFHRIVPNFVIQGGSPGANEYAGAPEYMRDEISLAMNERGTVGLSTRGRNTGDAQIFVNLVDNPRLDFDYTVFATVFPDDLPVVDGIMEGDTISSIHPVACR